MSNLIKIYKQDLKNLAKSIREMKNTRKGVPNGYVSGLFEAQLKFRYKHIAYCMLRGTPYEQIEQPLRPLKDHEWKEIKRLMVLDAKMYILVDENLSYAQKTVQAIHAATEYLKKYGINQPRWNNTVIVKAVETNSYYNRGKMFHWQCALVGVDKVTFVEPDMNNQETAMAFIESEEYMPESIKKLPLLK